MESKYGKLLMDDVRQLIELPEEDFRLVFPKLELKRLKRGSVLKKSGESDIVSRYLCSGFIGSYLLGKEKSALYSLYRATDTVFDAPSFRTGIPSDSMLKCISDVVFYEFTIDSEGMF